MILLMTKALFCYHLPKLCYLHAWILAAKAKICFSDLKSVMNATFLASR